MATAEVTFSNKLAVVSYDDQSHQRRAVDPSDQDRRASRPSPSNRERRTNKTARRCSSAAKRRWI